MNEPLRILHVVSVMDYGGLETLIMNLYRKIDRKKIQFDFIVHGERIGRFSDEISRLGGRVFKVPKYRLINHFEYINSFEKIFNKFPKYKIVHAHVRSTASIYLKIAKKYDITTIAHSHSTSNGVGCISKIKDCLQTKITNYSDYFFAPSVEAAQWLFGKNILKNSNFNILLNAVDTSKFIYNDKIRDRVRKNLNINYDEILLGHIGNFKEEKNHKFLIDVFKEFNNKNPYSKLLLVGEGDLLDPIRNYVKSMGLINNVILLGARNDVNELIQGLDCFVFPSKYEGLGIVAVEAQLASVPVITSNKVPTEVIISNKIKFLSLNKPAKYWASEIKKSLEFKENANINVSKYDINKTVHYLEKFYKSI